MTRLPELEQELTAAATRLAEPRRKLGHQLRLAVPVLACLAALAVFLVTVDPFDNRRDGDGSTPPDRLVPPQAPGGPSAPPRVQLKPVPDSISPRLSFKVGDTEYSAVGLRSRPSLICVVSRPKSVACLRDRILRDALAKQPSHLFAAGGARGGGSTVTGFARNDVIGIEPLGPKAGTAVVLSRPWRPRPWPGPPIRFFLIVSRKPAEDTRQALNTPLRVRLSNGRQR